MKKIMLIGESGSGKSSLIKALSDEPVSTGKAMAVEYCGQYINTPGEFLENRRFYPALITTSADSSVIAMLQDALRNSSLFPPQFASIFSRRVVGIVTKVDAAGADLERAERFLKYAGATEIIQVSSKNGTGLEKIRDMLA